jgi:hypothetical protein
MIRLLTAGALLAALGNAPLQCGRDPDPALRGEDSAGDALYALADEFRAKGDEPARSRTLRYLVEHYPSNRHVPAARTELASAGEPGPDAGK